MKHRSTRAAAFAGAMLTLALWLAAPGRAAADHELTKEEAAAGWINLFDGETTFGWNSLGDVPWRVEGGALTADTGTGGWLATTSAFTDFELVAKVRVMAGGSAGIVFRAGLGAHPSENGGGVITIAQPKEGEAAWHEVKVTANGGKITAMVDGKEAKTGDVTRAIGHIGFQFHTFHRNAKNKVEISQARLKPLNLKPIFNGKDLTEWNVIPGKKSVFAVVDSSINIKNGNGQIETKGVYKDFALQLDIISNGDKLNSGVFYRGPVGVFWKGYESQVRNDWKDDDRTKPNDFGTGGNYGNQPARKVVSTDREWFKKTVIVNGNHAAVWINGYLASDYTDTRPVSPENDGKNGYVPGPGTIHLQGHDPTTDLSFKNINLAEYPGK